ncbi:MAG: TGS domain-containing protein, partial [Alphaproteobacteria bacterium]|nr:TGS domain-containing protein [Alphaproteobacteria bacterium]
MFQVALKDGTKREFDSAVTALAVAQNISPRLAKEAVAARVNGELWDLTRTLPEGAALEIVTRIEADGLDIIRHDVAHVLAEAVKELYPSAQITIGPSIENGFYYDIFSEKPFTLDDLVAIEAKMHAIIKRDEPFTREEWDRDEAIVFFKSIGEHFKAEIIEGIPAGDTITLYRQGNFIDLCRGPHLPSTGRIGTAFKLMKLAGAYWRGDSKNPMLQRIYGTAWATDAQLKEHLFQLEEAEKRDHRKLGAELGLFHIQEEAVGAVFWHPKGWRLYRALETFVRTCLEKSDYVEVKTPQLLDRRLWEESGHWDMYGHAMFT